MSPTLQALAALFRRHPGQWLSHATIYEAAKHNGTGRISDLRKLGFKIEQKGAAESSSYRMTFDPAKPVYRTLHCHVCAKDYTEPQAIAATYCPIHGVAMTEVEAPKQEDLFGVLA